MYAIIAHLLLLSAIGSVYSRTNPDDVIWFPIDDYENRYESSLGEVYVTRPANDWIGGRSRNVFQLRPPARAERSLPGQSRRNYFSINANDVNVGGNFGEDSWATSDTKRAALAAESIVFPGETNVNRESGMKDQQRCQRRCPLTREYNPVCGTDAVNYNNIGLLRCAQFCGKRVNFAHYGICGKGLPGIFRPGPRPPRTARSTTERIPDSAASADQLIWPLQDL